MTKRDVENLAQEAEEASKRGELSVVYKISRQLCGKNKNNDMPVVNKDGLLLTTEKDQLERWAEHFNNILNCTEGNNVTPDIQPFGEPLDISEELCSKEEIKRAVKQLKNGKASGVDNISAELLKVDIDTSSNILHYLFSSIWENEVIPSDWDKGIIVKLPKNGDLKLMSSEDHFIYEHLYSLLSTLNIHRAGILGR